MYKIMVNGIAVDWREGLSLTQVLKERGFPLTSSLVSMDGVLYKPESFSATFPPHGAELKVIRLMSGG